MKKDSTSKILCLLGFIMFRYCLTANAQCTASFTYALSQPKLYAFNNTSTIIDSSGITWYVDGPSLVYVSNDVSPSFYFPVNGTYYVTLSTNYCGYVIDTINITGLTTSGACAAGMTYYPTYGQNFQFNDASLAMDSIVNYTWHGFTPPDSFIMVNGWNKNTDLSLWAYNGCAYPLYVITHTITTINGCQSSIVDTVHDYCEHCGASLEPGIIVSYDSLSHYLVFSDTIASGQITYKYWRFGTSDNNTLFSNADTPTLSISSDSLEVVCLDVYDTVNHCTASVCDSFKVLLPTGAQNLSAIPQVELINLPGALQIRYSNIALDEFELYDVIGKRILAARVSVSPVSLPLPALSAGIYFVRMMAGNNSICRKFMVR